MERNGITLRIWNNILGNKKVHRQIFSHIFVVLVSVVKSLLRKEGIEKEHL